MTEKILEALSIYGAALDADGFVMKNGRTLSVKLIVAKGRLRAEDKRGHLIASFPNKPESVHTFVKRYWFWEAERAVS